LNSGTKAQAWASGLPSDERTFDGTVAALARAYQRDQASPYAMLTWNTRREYGRVPGTIEKAFGQRSLAVLQIGDFRRWYNEAAKPKGKGGKPRVGKAHGIISMFRHMFSYGIMRSCQNALACRSCLDPLGCRSHTSVNHGPLRARSRRKVA
jgi:hypothetical protein